MRTVPIIAIAFGLASVAEAQSFVVDRLESFGRSRLTGRVVNADGGFLPGATVKLLAGGRDGTEVLATARCGDDGRFEFVDPRTGTSRYDGTFLTVCADGLAPSRVENAFIAATFDAGDIALFAPVELRGRVTREDGTPVACARIHATLGRVRRWNQVDPELAEPIAVTDDTGAYVCKVLPPGLVTLGASADGCADQLLPVRELPRRHVNVVDFVMQPEKVLHVVVRGADGISLRNTRAAVVRLHELDVRAADSDSDRRAFWRPWESVDADGRFTVRGLPVDAKPNFFFEAPLHVPIWPHAVADGDSFDLEPITWVDVTAVRSGGGPMPELDEVVLDKQRTELDEGDCGMSYQGTALGPDSPAVQRLAPNQWRIAWRSTHAYAKHDVREVRARARDGGRATVKLSEEEGAEDHVRCEVAFQRLRPFAGTVVDTRGRPVSLRFGCQLSFNGRMDFLAVESDAEGRFDFGEVGNDFGWLQSLDARWELDGRTDKFDVAALPKPRDVRIVVHPVEPCTSRVRGTVHVDGRTPSEPLLVALDRADQQHLPNGYPCGWAWTDAGGRFDIAADARGRRHVVVKRAPVAGGWRDFSDEFRQHGNEWPWTVSVPSSGAVEIDIDLQSNEGGR